MRVLLLRPLLALSQPNRRSFWCSWLGKSRSIAPFQAAHLAALWRLHHYPCHVFPQNLRQLQRDGGHALIGWEPRPGLVLAVGCWGGGSCMFAHTCVHACMQSQEERACVCTGMRTCEHVYAACASSACRSRTRTWACVSHKCIPIQARSEWRHQVSNAADGITD